MMKSREYDDTKKNGGLLGNNRSCTYFKASTPVSNLCLGATPVSNLCLGLAVKKAGLKYQHRSQWNVTTWDSVEFFFLAFFQNRHMDPDPGILITIILIILIIPCCRADKRRQHHPFLPGVCWPVQNRNLQWSYGPLQAIALTCSGWFPNEWPLDLLGLWA